MHPHIGHEMLKDIEFSAPIATIVSQHHERLDGSGYPLGLRGDAITLEAKILSVADVVEACVLAAHARPEAIGESINVGGGRRTTVLGLVEILKPRPKTLP